MVIVDELVEDVRFEVVLLVFSKCRFFSLKLIHSGCSFIVVGVNEFGFGAISGFFGNGGFPPGIREWEYGSMAGLCWLGELANCFTVRSGVDMGTGEGVFLIGGVEGEDRSGEARLRVGGGVLWGTGELPLALLGTCARVVPLLLTALVEGYAFWIEQANHAKKDIKQTFG